jgi:hypothetical protein
VSGSAGLGGGGGFVDSDARLANGASIGLGCLMKARGGRVDGPALGG